MIIPALNEADLIAQSIERARQVNPHEVIVVDGGSDDETLQIARQQACLVLHSERSRAAQQNHGARHATGDVLLFLHADCWLPPAGHDQITKALTDPRAVGGAFRQRIDDRGALFRLIERGDALRVQWFGMAYGDQGIFMRRPVFDKIGGFPNVRLMEDVLIMRKLRRRGRIALLPGPLHVSARRWRKHGVLRQTLRNWLLLSAERAGVSPDRLANYYQEHSAS